MICGRIKTDNDNSLSRSERLSGFKNIVDSPAESPRIRRRGRIKQGNWNSRDITQLNELVPGVAVCPEQRRLVEDFRDDNRPHARSRVHGPEGVETLRDEMFIAHTVQVAAEGNAILRGAEIEPVRIAGKIALSIGGKQENVIAQIGVKQEAVGCLRIGIKIGLIENQECVCADHSVSGEAILVRHPRIVSEKPIADIHIGAGGVVQFNGIDLRRIGMGQRLGNEDRRNRLRGRIRDPGGTAFFCAGTPVSFLGRDRRECTVRA